MPSEITARANQPSDAPNEGDYQTFCETLSASARGRAFLTEYTRRNRNADTEQLLAAIDRLQSLVSANAAPQTSVKQELRALLDEINAAQRELDASILSIKAAKLAELIALVERRISNLLVSLHAEPIPNTELLAPTPRLPHEPIEEIERTHLAVVPPPEQPELPIPSPASTQPPPIALVRSKTIMAEVAFVEPPPEPLPQPMETVPAAINTLSSEPETPNSPEPKPAAKTSPSANPLASIMALSEEERLALFT